MVAGDDCTVIECEAGHSFCRKCRFGPHGDLSWFVQCRERMRVDPVTTDSRAGHSLPPATPHHSTDSEEYAASHLAATERWRALHTKPCGKCSAPIEKSGGCSHM